MDEFTIRLASKQENSKTSVFKLHKDDDVSWKDARMKRENEYQPWQIKLGSGKLSRNFKAIKEGGVGDNTSFYVMYKNDPNSKVFHACPVDDWYTMSATQRYKTLTAEEAEEKFEKRHKMFNLFSVMGIKKGNDDGAEGEMSNSKGFKVSEFDEWNQSGDDEASSQEGEDGDESKRKVRRKKGVKKEDDAPVEGKEESDEGDFEEREVDYMSDSSGSSEAPEERKEENDVKGIAEEEGLRDLLSTEDEDDDNPDKTKKQEITQFVYKSDVDGSGSDDSSDSDDYDVDDEKMDSVVAKDDLPASVRKELKQDSETTSIRSDNSTKSTSTTNVNKRKISPEVNTTIATSQPSKRPCISENPSSSSPSTPSSQSSSAFERTVEGLIVKYLRRKPMTLKGLLKEIMMKLKKMDDATRDQQNLVETMGDIIKRLKPDQQKINGVNYLSIKKDQ